MTVRNPESEHSPMSGWDEYPIHQIAAPLRVVATTDARAYERYWFSVYDTEGEFVMMTGLGFYPNIGTVDAFVTFNHDHKHTTVRAHRYLNDTRNEITCGPFTFTVVEPFRQWRLELADNEHGVSFDLDWRDTKRAVFQDIGHRAPFTGRMATETVGYETFARVSGRIAIDGKTFTLDPARTLGTRDHHWGQRQGVGGAGHLEPMPRYSHFGQWAEFKDWGIWYGRLLRNIGDDQPGAVAITRSERELYFDPETDHFLGGTVVNHLENGETKTITYEQIDDKVAYLRTALYIGPDLQGTPDGNLYQGSDVGDGVTARVDYDISDPKTRIRLGGFEDHLVRATCDGESTVGLVEVMNPVPFEWAKAGVPGFTLVQK